VQPRDIVQLVCQAIVDKKGSNIVTLDVREVCSITDYFIIAEGSVNRHVVALAQQIDKALSEHGIGPIHVEGKETGDWIVLDYFDVIVHLFTPELRPYYALEEMWNEGTLVDVPVHYERIPSKH